MARPTIARRHLSLRTYLQVCQFWPMLNDTRAASESISREVPLNNMLIPTSVPMTHPVLDGHVLQIIGC